MAHETLKVRPSIKGAARAAGFVKSFCGANGIGQETAYALCTVIDEILPNIISLCTSPRIELIIESDKDKIVFTIKHRGLRYDFSDKNNIIWPDEMKKSKITPIGLDTIHGLTDAVECGFINDEIVTGLTMYIKEVKDGNKNA